MNEEFKKKFTKTPFSIVLDNREDPLDRTNRDYYNAAVPIEKLAYPITMEQEKAYYDRKVYELRRISDLILNPDIYYGEDDYQKRINTNNDADMFLDMDMYITTMSEVYGYPTTYEECIFWVNECAIKLLKILEANGKLKEDTASDWIETFKSRINSMFDKED